MISIKKTIYFFCGFTLFLNIYSSQSQEIDWFKDKTGKISIKGTFPALINHPFNIIPPTEGIPFKRELDDAQNPQHTAIIEHSETIVKSANIQFESTLRHVITARNTSAICGDVLNISEICLLDKKHFNLIYNKLILFQSQTNNPFERFSQEIEHINSKVITMVEITMCDKFTAYQGRNFAYLKDNIKMCQALIDHEKKQTQRQITEFAPQSEKILEKTICSHDSITQLMNDLQKEIVDMKYIVRNMCITNILLCALVVGFIVKHYIS